MKKVKLGNDTKRLLRQAKEDSCGSTSVGGWPNLGLSKKTWLREDIKVSGEGDFPLKMLWLFQYFPKGQLAVNALTMTSHRVVYLTRYSCPLSEEANEAYNKAENKTWKLAGWEVIERKAEKL